MVTALGPCVKWPQLVCCWVRACNANKRHVNRIKVVKYNKKIKNKKKESKKEKIKYVPVPGVVGHIQSVKILVILNPASYMLKSSSFSFIHLTYNSL